MNDTRPTESEVTIGRLKKRIAKLQEQRDSYKKQLEHYKIVVGGEWRIEHRHKTWTETKAERLRVRDMETRLKEQEELIKLLREKQ